MSVKADHSLLGTHWRGKVEDLLIPNHDPIIEFSITKVLGEAFSWDYQIFVTNVFPINDETAQILNKSWYQSHEELMRCDQLPMSIGTRWRYRADDTSYLEVLCSREDGLMFLRRVPSNDLHESIPMASLSQYMFLDEVTGAAAMQKYSKLKPTKEELEEI